MTFRGLVIAHATPFHATTAARWARGVLASYERMTPPRDRRVDANGLSFPLQLTIMIASMAVTCALTVYGTIWATSSKQDAANASMRTDIAVIRQVQSDQTKVDEYKAKLEEANLRMVQQAMESIKAEVTAVRGIAQLANIEISNVRREMNERKTK